MFESMLESWNEGVPYMCVLALIPQLVISLNHTLFFILSVIPTRSWGWHLVLGPASVII